MTVQLRCKCGNTVFEVEGSPIMSCDCACESCRKAAASFAKLPGGFEPGGPSGTTHFVLYRKDRVRCLSGAESLAQHRLTEDAPTRRAVARCCDTPVFLEFEGGHWLSLYAGLWPEASRPYASLRTMVNDLPAEESLPDDIPNHGSHSVRFMWKLAAVWVAMGFRVPAVTCVRGGTLEVWRQASSGNI